MISQHHTVAPPISSESISEVIISGVLISQLVVSDIVVPDIMIGTSGTLPDFDIEVMDFDIEAWTPIYVYPYIGVPKLRY